MCSRHKHIKHHPVRLAARTGWLCAKLAIHGFSGQEQEEPPEIQHARQQLQATTEIAENPATDGATGFEDEDERTSEPSSAGLSPIDGVHHAP